MLANELINAIKKVIFKKYFGGIFAIDNLPKKIYDKHFIIVNTDISEGPGKHWFTLVRLKNTIEYFDSLGVDKQKQDFICSHFNITGISYVALNKTQLQPLTSSLCGEYVLFYLFERYHNLDLDFDELLNQIFSENFMQNDETVIKFMTDFLQ